MKHILLLSLILLLAFKVQAQVTSQDLYLVKEYETLESIAKKFHEKYMTNSYMAFQDYKRLLQEWNPHVKNWEDIPTFTNIYVTNPYGPYIDYEFAPKLSPGINEIIEDGDLNTPLAGKNYTLFFRYGAHQSRLTEKNEASRLSLKSQQNSFLNLSLGGSYLIQKDKRYFETLLSWTKFQNSDVQGGSGQENLSIPSEYDLYFLYAHRLTKEKKSSLTYAQLGMDYESFPVLNTQDYILNRKLSYLRQELYFFNLGVEQVFFWGDYKLKSSLNAGQTVHSQASEGESFKGQRYQVQFSLKGKERFTYHLFYKYYQLDGPHKIGLSRLGGGLGFLIF